MQGRLKGRFRVRFSAELEKLSASGVLSAEHAAAVRSHYGLGNHQDELKRRRRLTILTIVAIVASLAGIQVGLGIILLIAAHLGVPAWLKLSLLVAAMAACYVFGYRLRFSAGAHPRIGSGLIVLGALIYGGAIWLLAQAFQVDVDFPQGLFWWAVGVYLLVPLVETPELLGLSAILWSLWGGAQLMRQFNVIYFDFRLEEQLVRPGAALALVLLVVPYCYRLRSVLCLAIASVGFLAWYFMQMGALDYERLAFFSLFAFAGLFYALALVTDAFGGLRKFSILYRGLAWLIGLVMLYIFSFADAVDEMAHEMEHLVLRRAEWIVLACLLALVLALLIAALVRARKLKTRGLQIEVLAAIVISILWLPLLVASKYAFLLALGYNLVMMAAAFGIVSLGVVRQRLALVYGGIALFCLLLITRYFSVLGSYLNTGILFVGSGVILFVVAWLLARYAKRIYERYARAEANSKPETRMTNQ